MEQTSQSISIRPLGEGDLPEANAILRRAFATQFAMPPDTFWTDQNLVTGRWMTDPSLAFGAWIEDRLVGSSLGANWGSLGIFGPISTHPDTWNRGIAKHLIPPVLERLEGIGGSAPRSLHICGEHKTHCAVSEVWLLAAVSYRDHDPPDRGDRGTASIDPLLCGSPLRSRPLA